MTAQTVQDCTWQSYRLPTNVLPTAYRITLQTVLEDQSNVTGRVEIDLDVARPSTCVVMHAVGMTISDIFAVSREGSEQQGELMLRHMHLNAESESDAVMCCLIAPKHAQSCYAHMHITM